MLDKVDWKKFGNATLVLLIGLLLFDMLWDLITVQRILWFETFHAPNIIYKIATAFIGAYFYASSDPAPPEEKK